MIHRAQNLSISKYCSKTNAAVHASSSASEASPPHKGCYALLCFAMLCYALLCFAMLCFAMLCFPLLCFALLCLALLRYALLCYALLCYAFLCSAMLCFAMLCFAFALICSAMLCFAMLCFAVLCLAIRVSRQHSLQDMRCFLHFVTISPKALQIVDLKGPWQLRLPRRNNSTPKWSHRKRALRKTRETRHAGGDADHAATIATLAQGAILADGTSWAEEGNAGPRSRSDSAAMIIAATSQPRNGHRSHFGSRYKLG